MFFNVTKIILIIFFIIIGVFVIAINIVNMPIYKMQKNDVATSTVININNIEMSKSKDIVLAFGGDVMLSRVVGQKIVKNEDFSWPFKYVADVFKTADIAMINLESPFTTDGDYFVPTGSFSFDADEKTIETLGLGGIDVVALANNHFGNQGQQGMKDTFEVLNKSKIKYVGAGIDEAASRAGEIIEVSGIKFGFLAYAYPDDMYIATEDKAGMANMDINKAKQDIDKLRSQVDVLVVNMHAGTEYVNQPTKQQKDFAHTVIDVGADLVIGHHPHWAQVTEIYQGKPILYSLGNLVFDQMWSRKTQQGVIAKVYFSDSDLQKIEIIPIHIYDYGQPKIVDDEKEIKEILDQMELDDEIINLK